MTRLGSKRNRKMTSKNNRSHAREYASLFLYHSFFQEKNQLPQTESQLDDTLSYFNDSLPNLSGHLLQFAKELLLNCSDHYELIQEEIEKHLINWKYSRVNKVDLTLLFLAITEIKFQTPATPLAVVINEYVELAKKYGNQESPKFINGVLDRIGKQL